MMKCLYPYHDELKKAAAGDTSKFKMNPAIIHICAKLAKISKRFVKIPKDFTRTEVHIKNCDNSSFSAELYSPRDIIEPAPCLIYYPGGGFVVGAYPYMHTIAMMYGRYADCKVLFVNYRMANETGMAGTMEDGYRALQFTFENAREMGIDREKIVVGGDSAGATIATATALMARDRKGPEISGQMLMYPCTSIQPDTWSRQHFNNTPGINSDWVEVFFQEALKNGCSGYEEYMSPLKAESLKGLPFTYIETEEFCPLRDEGNLYAKRLKETNVPVIHREMKGTFHAFDSDYKIPMVQQIIRERGKILSKMFC